MAPASDGASLPPPAHGASRVVLRNTTLVTAAQSLAAPLSLLVSAVAAHKLGPADFGHLYLAASFASTAFILVEWGQGSELTARIARQHSAAGELLGSSLAWRLAVGALAALLLPLACRLAGYDRVFAGILSLTLAGCAFASLGAACQDAMRGYERSGFSAACALGAQLGAVLVLVPILLAGSGLFVYLAAQAVIGGLGALVLVRAMAPLGVPQLRPRTRAMGELLRGGTPFVVFNLVVALQTGIDAAMLSRFASAESIGWYATARKLTGGLLIPANALIAALFPTLCRLHAGQPAAAAATLSRAVQWTVLCAVPVALGCALYPELGVQVFGGAAYGGAAEDLRMLAPFMLLVYATMPLGTALMATGHRRAWTLSQLGCLVVSAVLDPLLIPWFQARTGNGAMGVCVGTVASETLMLAAALTTLRSTALNAILLRAVARGAAGGAVMLAASVLLSSLNPWLAAPCAVAAYALSLAALGKFGRAGGSAPRKAGRE
ncbi:oligosaccharide flippase family protein [Nevskia soli]|uniref:oligosaccharide flippase family protein n=1 Tax=Nevskia soli TaxID=418856 RepID=UPI0004A7520D|nr:oligosaccharide flippase family protein [Nevskia soli]